jgi:uncharacterized membrane protein
MVDDKLVSRSFWVGDIQHVRIVLTILINLLKIYYNKIKKNHFGVMAERLLRSTVNTFFHRFESY